MSSFAADAAVNALDDQTVRALLTEEGFNPMTSTRKMRMDTIPWIMFAAGEISECVVIYFILVVPIVAMKIFMETFPWLLQQEHFEVVQWLILNRALSSPLHHHNKSGINNYTMRRALRPKPNCNYDKRLAILSWAQDIVTAHANIILCLKGTIIGKI